MIRQIFTIFFTILLFTCLNAGTLMAQCKEGDCLNGTGTMVYPSGSRYVGEFKNGLFNGSGTMYFYNGSKYEGNWKDGVMEGEGTWFYSNGLSMKSSFRGDRATGEVSMSRKVIEKPVDRLASLVPSATDALIVLHSLDTFFKYFPLNSDNFGGKPMPEYEKKDFMKHLGFNPLDRTQLLDAGFDPDREVGVSVSDMKVISGNNISVNMLFCMPVLDGEKALNTVKQALRKSSRNSISFMRLEKTLKAVIPYKEMSIYMALSGKYLLISFNPKGDSLPYITETLEGKTSLRKNPLYREVAGRINTGEEIFMYLDGKKIFEFYYLMLAQTLSGRGQEMAMLGAMNSVSREMIKDYRGMGMTFDCDSKDLVIKSVFNVASGASMLRLYSKIAWDREPLMGYQGSPLFLMSMGINMQEYYALLSRSMSPFVYGMIESQLSQFTKEYKVDIKKEIIDNMAGTINAGAFDGSTFQKDTARIFLTFNVKDRKILDGVISRLSSTLPAKTIEMIEKKPHPIYRVKLDNTPVYFSIKKKTCVVALSPDIIRKVNTARWSRGFLKKMPDKKLAEGLRKNQSIIYLDGPELRKAMKNLMNTDSRRYRSMDSILSWYRYLYIYYTVKNDSVYSTFEVRTDFKQPFFNGIADSIVNKKQ